MTAEGHLQLDYTGVNGATGTTTGAYSETIQLTATEWNFQITASGSNLTFKATYTVAGTTFTPTKVCPASGNAPTPLGYSVIGNEIHFLDMGAGAMSARVLVRQQ